MKILGIGTSPIVRRAAKFADAGGIVKPACSPHKQTRRGGQVGESIGEATQRKITVESFDLVHLHRPDVQMFNELLVQYPDPNGSTRKPRQVVPDNTIIVWDEPIVASGSYDVSLQPTGPFCVLEYVSKNSVRKDYEDNMEKYERHLKVPYYLLFYPD